MNATLDYVALQEKNFRMKYSWIDIQQLLDEVTNLISLKLKLKKSVELISFIAEDVPLNFWTDY
jgi:hypothetical protein